MTGNSCVVVLLQDPAAEVLVPRDNNLATEVEQTGVDMPCGRPGWPGSSDLQDLLGHERDWVLKVRFTGKGPVDVTEEQNLQASDDNTL